MSGPPPVVPIHVWAWMVPLPAVTVTTPFANVGHAPLAVGRCVGSTPTPPLLEPPEDDVDPSAAPLEPPSFEPLLDPDDASGPELPPEEPEPLDDAVPPELAPLEPLPLLEPPPSPVDGDELELPHAATTAATSTPMGTSQDFIGASVRDGGTRPRSGRRGNQWKSERRRGLGPVSEPSVQGGEQTGVLEDGEAHDRQRHGQRPGPDGHDVVEPDDVYAHEGDEAEHDERLQDVALHGTLATTKWRSCEPMGPLSSTSSPAPSTTRRSSEGSRRPWR